MTKILGHRGASAYAPENSLDAFALALDQGADGVELDARLTRDRHLVVHHDPVLGDRSDLPSHVPTLVEVLALIPDALINIELKSEPEIDPDNEVARAVAEVAPATALVSSFRRSAVETFARLRPEVAVGLLTIPTVDQMEQARWAADSGLAALHPFQLSVNAELCDGCHALGLQVNTWTVDDPDRMLWLRDCGVDLLITNVPDVAVRALRGG